MGVGALTKKRLNGLEGFLEKGKSTKWSRGAKARPAALSPLRVCWGLPSLSLEPQSLWDSGQSTPGPKAPGSIGLSLMLF